MNQSDPFDPLVPRPDSPDQGRRSILRGFFTLGAAFGALPLLGNSLLLRAAEGPGDDMDECPTTLTQSQSHTYSVVGTVPATFTASGVGQPPTSGGNTETYTGVNETGLTRSHTEVWPAPGGTTQPVTIAHSFTMSHAPSGGQTITYSWKGNSFTQTISRHPTKWSLTYTHKQTLSYTSTTPCEETGDDTGGAPAPIELPDAGTQTGLGTLDLFGADLFDPHSRGESTRMLSLAACGASRGARGQFAL